MKDDYKRIRKAEQHLISTVPNVDSNLEFGPIHQESLDTEPDCAMDVTVQGNEFIVVVTTKWCLQVYVLDKTTGTKELNTDSISEMSDDELLPAHFRTPLWSAVPRPDGDYYETLSNCTFIAPDIIGCSIQANVSTWYVRSGEQLDSITVRGNVYFDSAICKINDTEFVIGTMEGHIFVFTHNRGSNLRETKRIRKAHYDRILTLAIHKNMIVSASFDWSARVWDATSKTRLGILKHGGRVVGVALSGEYIVTCTRSESETQELRFFRNENEYALVKILHVHNQLSNPTVLNAELILFRFSPPIDEEPDSRDHLCILDFERGVMLAQLKFGCRYINDYEVLPDGRIIAVGVKGCSGVIAKFPRRVRKLIAWKSAGNASGDTRRRMCVLV